jgi:hypothetical protein
MPEGYAFTPGPQADQASPPPSFTRDLLWAVEAGTHPGTINDEERARVLADLRAWHVEVVIVGPMNHQAEAVAIVSQLFGQPTVSGGIYLWSEDQPLDRLEPPNQDL